MTRERHNVNGGRVQAALECIAEGDHWRDRARESLQGLKGAGTQTLVHGPTAPKFFEIVDQLRAARDWLDRAAAEVFLITVPRDGVTRADEPPAGAASAILSVSEAAPNSKPGREIPL